MRVLWVYGMSIAYNAQTNLLSVQTNHKFPLNVENSENSVKYGLEYHFSFVRTMHSKL